MEEIDAISHNRHEDSGVFNDFIDLAVTIEILGPHANNSGFQDSFDGSRYFLHAHGRQGSS